MVNNTVINQTDFTKTDNECLIAELVDFYGPRSIVTIGSDQETVVKILQHRVKSLAIERVATLNGTGSPIFDIEDRTFTISVDSVCKDIANAIVKNRYDEANLFFESCADDVLSEQAHLKLDF